MNTSTAGGVRRLWIPVVAAALLAALVAPVSSPATAEASTPDAVVVWNEHATDALIVTALQGPTVAILHLAMVHGAVYDAVNAIDGGYEPYLGAPVAQPWYSTEAAAAVAAHGVLVSIVPTQQGTLDGHLVDSLAAIPDGPAKDGGMAVGAAAAATMIAERTGDGRFGAPGFPVGTEPGEWRPTLPLFVNDPAAWVADVDPFLIRNPARFRSAGPDALTSAHYTADFAEVKADGSLTSTTRTADQTDAARFWAEHPPAMWSRIFRQISAAERLSIVDNARMFAMLYLTAADAAISVWDDKGFWLFWRPITAIREADTDGNPATAPDTEWLPLINTPPYPDHPSGHSGLSGSIVRTLQHFFGTNRMDFSATSAVSGTTRSFTRFSQAINEIVDARVWSGIHFRLADEAGQGIGVQVANFRQKNYLHPVD